MRWAVISLAVALAGCSTNLPVRGQMQGSPEAFSGRARANMNGAGTLTIVTSIGVHCSGDFVYVTTRQGSGTFTCEDGRSGPFAFYSQGTRGTGYGTLGNERFTFTIGN